MDTYDANVSLFICQTYAPHASSREVSRVKRGRGRQDIKEDQFRKKKTYKKAESKIDVQIENNYAVSLASDETRVVKILRVFLTK